MKTKDQLAEDKGLVRDIIAMCEMIPADDYERKLRDGVFRKAFAELPGLEIQFVRRIEEVLCNLDFPSATALGLRRAVLDRMARHHELRKYRLVKVPAVTPPQPVQP